MILERIYEFYLDIVSQLSYVQSSDCLGGKTAATHRDIQAFFTVVPAILMAPVHATFLSSSQETRETPGIQSGACGCLSGPVGRNTWTWA